MSFFLCSWSSFSSKFYEVSIYIKFSDVVNRNACKSLFWIKFISLLTKSNKFNFLENMSLVSRNKFSYFFFHEAYSKLFSLFVAERYPIDMIHVSEKKFFLTKIFIRVENLRIWHTCIIGPSHSQRSNFQAGSSKFHEFSRALRHPREKKPHLLFDIPLAEKI